MPVSEYEERSEAKLSIVDYEFGRKNSEMLNEGVFEKKKCCYEHLEGSKNKFKCLASMEL